MQVEQTRCINDYAPVTARTITRPLYLYGKRLFDVVVALMLLVVLAPLLLLIALVIKLTSRGSVLFIQERAGCKPCVANGHVTWELRTFPFYKFRSMFDSVDQSLHEQCVRDFCNGADGLGEGSAKFKLHNDPRVTPIGRFLRKTSFDELPQLLNVLKGEMSLVGPRPVPVYELACYKQPHYERFTALPGISGYWQVEGRGRVPFEEMIRMDVEYARTASLWLDLVILAKTIPAVLSGRGAQ